MKRSEGESGRAAKRSRGDGESRRERGREREADGRASERQRERGREREAEGRATERQRERGREREADGRASERQREESRQERGREREAEGRATERQRERGREREADGRASERQREESRQERGREREAEGRATERQRERGREREADGRASERQREESRRERGREREAEGRSSERRRDHRREGERGRVQNRESGSRSEREESGRRTSASSSSRLPPPQVLVAEGSVGGGGQALPSGSTGGRAQSGSRRGGGRGGPVVLDRETRQRFAEERYDLVISRPNAGDGMPLTKKADLGNAQPVRLQANFFKVESRPNWRLFHYNVSFSPDEPDFDTRLKKGLFREHSAALGANLFDGSSLFVTREISPQPMTLNSTRQSDQKVFTLTLKLVGELAPTDVTYLQLYNILVRKALEKMKLEEMGHNFYDRSQAISIHAHHLELWPGFKTAMRNYEHDILLQVEITHKVLRLDNCLQVMRNLRTRDNEYDQERIRTELVGSVVMTIYNRKTYSVDDIDWESTPRSSFEIKNGEMITYLDYFKSRYNLDIRDTRQPLLVSRPTKKDLHRGFQGKIMLIPEFCQRTGLTDQMRTNNQLMRALATHLHTDPQTRVGKLNEFMRKMNTTPEIVEELRRWGLRFCARLVEVDGRILPNERILFGNETVEMPSNTYDWNNAFRNKPMYSSVPLKTWVLITASSGAGCVDKLVNSLQRVAHPLNFPIANPIRHRVPGDRPSDYAKAVDNAMNEYKGKVQLLFVILPRFALDTYSAVKKRSYLEFGVPSQCFVAKNAQNDRGLMSICTKLVVQMNAKLGGEPWTLKVPLTKLMVVGFDVHISGKRTGPSVGAMVASTSETYGKYFSTTSLHSSRNEMSAKMGPEFTKCLHAYHKVNDFLPDRIIMYHAGVGEGQLSCIYNTELKSIRDCIYSVYKSAGREDSQPKFSFIVVSRRINTKLFASDPISGRAVNPAPGTSVDDVITFPERYDFYLVSQFARQGTVSPVSYNVLFDTQQLSPDRMQRLTFKLCHLYYNWSGTVTVPGPCQYARKLAYLTGLSLGDEANDKLSNSLYFL